MHRENAEFPGERGAGSDSLSDEEHDPRRAVHPYRDARDALMERRRRLARELAEAERAARRCARLARELAEIDEELDALHAQEREMRSVFERPAPTSRAVHVAAIALLLGAGAGATAAAALMLSYRAQRIATASVVQPVATTTPAVAAAPVLRQAWVAPAARSLPEVHVDALQSTSAVPAGISRADLDRHVRWIAPQAWEVDGALVDRLLAQGSAATSARVIPDAAGLRIHDIRRDALLGRLGLRSGDVLVEVNGRSLTSSAGAFELYESLRTADAIFVRLERRGQERIHVYRIIR